MENTVIKVNGLTKTFGDINAVDHIDFEVEKGTMIGFLGINGAGKSTAINMMTTVLKPDEGVCEICGHILGKEDMKIREKIGIVYQQNCLDDILTVRENLMTRGVIHGICKKKAEDRIRELTEILKMEEILDRRYRKLSGGQKRRAEIAAALMNEPEILFLDEPTTGLDPATRTDVWNAIEDIKRTKSMTVFLTTHYMEEAASADKIIVIDHGKIRACGTPVQLKEQFAKDKVKIYASSYDSVEMMKNPVIDKYNKHKTDFGFEIEVENTVSASKPVCSLCECYKDKITGIEIILGSMDDVFLNIVGGIFSEEER